MSRRLWTIRMFPCLLALILALAAPHALAGFEETLTVRSDSLVINNLIGEVTVEGGGSSFEVVVRVQGKDGTRETIDIHHDGDEITVAFPSGERNYVYPNMGRGSRTSFTPERGESSWLSAVLGGVLGKRITVRGNGSGLEVWADIQVRVPEGAELRVNHGVGKIVAAGTDGDLRLFNRSGRIEASGIDGDLVADTGSGSVTVEDIRGNLLVDTGSGSVSVVRCDCDDVNIDTGSGSVTVEDIETRKLLIDTGSGGVRASGVSTENADIDTGSGAIRLELDRMGSGSYRLDTGSGGITLALPSGASADVEASTGSGGIRLDLDEDIRVRHRERDEMVFTVGDGGASVSLDTGSGTIRIVRAD